MSRTTASFPRRLRSLHASPRAGCATCSGGTMKWTKVGRVFCPDGNLDWMRTHAAGPIAEHLEGDFFRVYFGCRDAQNRTSIGSLDMDLTRPDRIENLARE